MLRHHLVVVLLLVVTGAFITSGQARAQDRSFAEGSLIVPMDVSYQDSGLLQAYGLVFQLLRQGVTVRWVIDNDKTWHSAPCDTAGDECAWDCADEGSGVKCEYPTASPDFFVGASVLWDSEAAMAPGTEISNHGYRGGPFVVDAADAARAMPIIEAWNNRDLWGDNPWAERTVFNVVSVHRATSAFDGFVNKTMIEAPTIAVFSDGNENIATGYLRAAGIPQSNGNEFPEGKCDDPDTCGPGTENPDMLSVVAIMGDMGTCDAPNNDHRNGALFNEAGNPAYCQIMSMHWGVNDRETVECDGGGCPATQAECSGETFTYHGHEVVAEVREFLTHPTHFFAECQAVNAYENTVPNPDWPYLDDEGRLGHFLTTTGTPPACPCDGATDGGDYECVTNGCDSGTRDCCLPSNDKERGAGFLIADRPDADTLQVLNPHVAYNQLDGAYETVGGSEPAYNLSSFLGTEYKNDRDVTYITGPDGPGDQDVWMNGFVDGACDLAGVEFPEPGECNFGKVSYLGGHRYSTDTPVSGNWDAQGTRLFLNALFEADCVTGGLMGVAPNVAITWSGASVVDAGGLPADEAYEIRFVNTGGSAATGAVLTLILPADLELVTSEAGGVVAGTTITWDLGDIGAGESGTRSLTVRFTTAGVYAFDASIAFSGREARSVYTVRVVNDRDGDSVPDDEDPFPDDPNRCGDSDSDSCDDCTSGTFDPVNDCTTGDAGPGGADDSGCDCRTVGAGDGERALAVFLLLCGGLLLRRRNAKNTRG